MNRFRDLSGNQFSRRSNNFRRNDSNNNRSGPPSSRFSSSNSIDLPKNNRWKRDNETQDTRNNFTRHPSKFQRFNHRARSHLEPCEINSKFVDTKSMAIGFEQITKKPRQSKKKKKKNNQRIVEKDKSHIKKYSKKYELSNDEDDKINASIINQYKYEVIEESSEAEDNGEGEDNGEDEQ